jgi:hypothetical protein
MHPGDIICGPYTYQCMQQPFTLRPDDLSALGQLYYIAQGTAPPGKTDTQLNANNIYGPLQFPTGQGMQGVNIEVRRWAQYTDISSAEDWFTASAVSGAIFRQSNGNPVTGADTSFLGTQGTPDQNHEGDYNVQRVPMLPGDWQILIMETEAINPLYTGQYAVGPYPANTVMPSGADVPTPYGIFGSYTIAYVPASTGAAASACDTSADGTEVAPSAVAATGWWTGVLCGYGHTAWSSLSVKAHRTFTMEVTAEDEQGFATTAKALPLIGVWNATDATGTLPTVAAASEPLNGEATGMTTLTVSNTQPDQLRIVIADQRGDGRPDFNYQARVLYADSVAPAAVDSAGGTVTITGMGFRVGDVVTVNGVAAAVSSWTANTIVASAPSLLALGSVRALAADIAVTDLSTGGTSTMIRALNYSASAATLNLVTAPSGTIAVGEQAVIPFAVQILKSDGVTPVVGEVVTFSVTTGSAAFSSCGGATCTVSTDAHGIASMLVTPEASGAIALEASGVDGSATASFNAIVRVQAIAAVQSTEYVAAGAAVVWTPQVSVTDNLASTAGLSVAWTATSGAVSISAPQSQVNGQGVAQTLATVGPIAAGAQASFSGCAWTNVCTAFTAWGVAPSQLGLIAVSGAAQIATAAGTLSPITLQVVDMSGHAVAGATVEVYQTIDAWQQPCPQRGRCPIPPTYASSQVSLVSDINGIVTIAPEQLTGIAEITNFAAATGTQGFLSATLQKQP